MVKMNIGNETKFNLIWQNKLSYAFRNSNLGKYPSPFYEVVSSIPAQSSILWEMTFWEVGDGVNMWAVLLLGIF